MTHPPIEEVREALDCAYESDSGINCHDLKHAAVIFNAAQAYCDMQWQPIETAPKDGSEIIITNGYDVYTGKYKEYHITNYAPYFCKSCDGYEINDGHDWESIPVYMYGPTHWMPLPQPPKEKQDEK